MCTYCMIADHFFRYDPPWPPINPYPIHPLIPMPINPPGLPWGVDRLKELQDLLRRVKDLEDKLGCPCEPNKADYLDLIKQRIEAVERHKGGLDLNVK
jgi:hypothetical protein